MKTIPEIFHSQLDSTRDRKAAATQKCKSKILNHDKINTLLKTYTAVGVLDTTLVLRQYNAYDNDNCRLEMKSTSITDKQCLVFKLKKALLMQTVFLKS